MMPTAINQAMNAALESAVDTLGTPATWYRTDPTMAVPIRVGVKTVGADEPELVNAYGLGAKVITIRISELPDVQKFDHIEIAGTRFTIDAVAPRHMPDGPLFHKCYVRGK